MTRRIVVIGNAPVRGSIADVVNSAAHVIRFNKACGFAAATGSRTDELYLVNHGGQMAEWLVGSDRFLHPVFSVARRIVLPIPLLPGHVSSRRAASGSECANGPTDPDRINHLAAARQALEGMGRSVDTFSVREYRQAQSVLRGAVPETVEPYPSTGFLALVRTLDRVASGVRLELYGFSFTGWSGHCWAAERDWVAAQAACGRLFVHDPDRNACPVDRRDDVTA